MIAVTSFIHILELKGKNKRLNEMGAHSTKVKWCDDGLHWLDGWLAVLVHSLAGCLRITMRSNHDGLLLY